MKGKKKVFVGLSGGVDSSVSAALLKEEGYDVVGVFIKVWQADFLPCTWREERRDAMRVAAHLGIPFLTLDLENEYKKEVVDYMIREYGSGRVPNPDVMCNKYVKFGAFLDFALSKGADFIATGHYATISRGKDNLYHLFEGKDKEKDQSYFLWTLTQKELSRTLFPIGHLKKNSVRLLGKKFALPTAEKKDSQGLCFMGPVDMTDFLRHYLKLEKGNVLDTDGRVIGTHNGAMVYTIGQRHGFTVNKTSPEEKPYFVVQKNINANTITVAHKDPESGVVGKTQGVTLDSFNNITGENFQKERKCTIRIRYHGKAHEATLAQSGDKKGSAYARFSVPIEAVAEGQSAVIYIKDECVAGGIVD